MPETEIETMNQFVVALRGDDVMVLSPPLVGQLLSKAEALNLAAWLVAIVGDADAFDAVLTAVQNT